MNNPFNRGEESSFEQGISVKKPIKAVSGASAQQAKQFRDDFLEQLYGKSNKASDSKSKNTNDPSKPTQAPPQKPQNTVHKLSGNSNVGDHAKYMARQAYIDKGDVKGAENAMHHLQYYFDANIMTLEDRVKKNRQEKEQKEMQRKQQEEEEEKRKKEEEEQKRREQPAVVTGKGRNKMGLPPGKKPKTPMSVQMGKNKAEMFRGTSG
jgi:hypothetical protein